MELIHDIPVQYPEDPDLDRVARLWLKLSAVRWACPPEKSIMDRLRVKDWESTDPNVRQVWLALTDPANISGLEKWGQVPMNPVAEEATREALAQARARASNR